MSSLAGRGKMDGPCRALRPNYTKAYIVRRIHILRHLAAMASDSSSNPSLSSGDAR
jgi:hypothetical protein